MKRNKIDVRDTDIATVLSSLGFENITEERPIRFIESLPYSFNDIHHVNNRWVRKSQDNVFSEVLIGLNSFNRIFIDVIVLSTYGECKSKVSEHIYCMTCEWENFLKKFISLNEQCVVRNALEVKEGMYKTE